MRKLNSASGTVKIGPQPVKQTLTNDPGFTVGVTQPAVQPISPPLSFDSFKSFEIVDLLKKQIQLLEKILRTLESQHVSSVYYPTEVTYGTPPERVLDDIDTSVLDVGYIEPGNVMSKGDQAKTSTKKKRKKDDVESAKKKLAKIKKDK